MTDADDKPPNENSEVLQFTNWQVFIGLSTAVSALVVVIGVLINFIAGNVLDKISNNTRLIDLLTDQYSTHDLEIAALKDRAGDCEALHLNILLASGEYRKQDERRMDKIESALSRLDADQASNRRSVAECWRRLP